MSYCTEADLIEQYGQSALITLTDRTNKPQSTIDSAVMARAIEGASDEINLYLEGRYGLPLPAVPRVLKRIACKLAYAHLHVHPKEGKDHPALLAADSERRVLNAIAKGTLSLGLSQAGAVIKAGDTVQISSGRNDWGARY